MKVIQDTVRCCRWIIPSLFFIVACYSQVSKNKIIPMETIEFLNQTFYLTWQSDPTPSYVKFEYLPKGQSLPYYEDMILLEVLISEHSTRDVVDMKIEELQQLATENPIVQHKLIENPQTGEYLLDFLVSASDEQHEFIVEWNAYRYIPYTNEQGEKGVQLFGYSIRSYDDEATEFLESLREKRQVIINGLAIAEVPNLE